MRIRLLLVLVCCIVCFGVVAQQSEAYHKRLAELTSYANRAGSLSANLDNLRKPKVKSRKRLYVVANDTIYTSHADMFIMLSDYSAFPTFWSIRRWVVEGDSIRCIGDVLIDYTEYKSRRNNFRFIRKFKLAVRDGHLCWRMRLSLFKFMRGEFPASIFDQGGKRKLRDFVEQAPLPNSD